MYELDEFDFTVEDAGRDSHSTHDFVRELKRRTKAVAINLVNLMERSGKSPALGVIRYQLLKSGTSVAANYRAACRARSKNEWYAKMCIVVEECDETVFWLELLLESEVTIDEVEVRTLGKEYFELLKIFAKARSTHKLNTTQ